MAISFINAGTVQAASAVSTSVTGTTPSGIVAGDLLLWVLHGNVAYAGTNPPTGWSAFASSLSTAQVIIWYRIATGTETATYTTATGGSGKWVTYMLAYRGVDTVNPQDATATTGTTTQPAITTGTANAWVMGHARITDASGVVGPTWSTTSGTVRAQGATQVSATTNTDGASIDQVRATPGAVTPALTSSSGGTVPIRLTVALRPFITGSGTGSTVYTGTATGKETPKASATPGATTYTGTATGKDTPKGSATGSTAYSGTATGTTAPKGSTTGSTVHTGTSTGKATAPKGAATGSTVYTGTATGKATPKASATGTTAHTGTASGKTIPKGTATGASPHTGTATGSETPKATATGATAHVGTGTGKATPKATGTGTAVYLGSSTGKATPKATATGATVHVGTASGLVLPKGNASGLTSYTGTSRGGQPRDITAAAAVLISRTAAVVAPSRAATTVTGRPTT